MKVLKSTLGAMCWLWYVTLLSNSIYGLLCEFSDARQWFPSWNHFLHLATLYCIYVLSPLTSISASLGRINERRVIELMRPRTICVSGRKSSFVLRTWWQLTSHSIRTARIQLRAIQRPVDHYPTKNEANLYFMTIISFTSSLFRPDDQKLLLPNGRGV